MANCTFDIACQVDLQEVDNAVNQAQREIATRYDFQGSKCEITLDKSVPAITVTASDELKMNAVIDVILTKMVKRSVPTKALVYGKTEPTGRVLKKLLTIQQGLSKEQCKEITQFVKGTQLKVQAQIMEDQIRVSGKSRDLLQDVMAQLRSKEFSFDMQFLNYR